MTQYIRLTTPQSAAVKTSSGSQEISHTLRKSKIRYYVHKPLPVPILSHMNLIQVLSSYFYIHFSIILPPTPRFSKWPLAFSFHNL